MTEKQIGKSGADTINWNVDANNPTDPKFAPADRQNEISKSKSQVVASANKATQESPKK